MRISDPTPNSNALTSEELQVYVKEVLVPIKRTNTALVNCKSQGLVYHLVK